MTSIFQKYLGVQSLFIFNNKGKVKAVSECRYSPDELRYLPLNTALYEPPLDPELPALDSDGDSDDAEDGRGDEKRKNKGTSVGCYFSRRLFFPSGQLRTAFLGCEISWTVSLQSERDSCM
jgi:hypothetical protein